MERIFLSPGRAAELEKLLASPEGGALKEALLAKGEKQAMSGPYSVTFTPSPAASGDAHDYFSEGPYWWPDPQNPQGPYIRRDGERNPHRFEAHSSALAGMLESVLDLSLAGYFLKRKDFSEKAGELLRVWFLDEKTRMNPHLEYAQAIRGICEGRGIGIIDTHTMIRVPHACCLLEQCSSCQETVDGVRQWFAQFLTWLLESEKGQAERHHGNNHSTWYLVQTITYSLFTRQPELAKREIEFYKTHILPRQIAPDGSQTDELTRTNSFTYSLFHLNAFAAICELGAALGMDLWRYEAEGGQSVTKMIEFLLPYLQNPEQWRWQQIHPEIDWANYGLLMAARRLDIPELSDWVQKVIKRQSVLQECTPLGPMALL